MKSDLSKVKVGDSIFTIQNGWVRVKEVTDGVTYPILAWGVTYTIEGKLCGTDACPCAFTHNPFESQFEGYWAMVSDYPITENNKGVKRFVFMEKNGNYIAWDGAATDERVAETTFSTSWKCAQRIPEPAPVPEYTVEELTALVGHEFKIKK